MTSDGRCGAILILKFYGEIFAI